MSLDRTSLANAKFFLILSGAAAAMPIGLLICLFVMNMDICMENEWGIVVFWILWSALPFWIAPVFIDCIQRPRLAGGVALAVTAFFWMAAAYSAWFGKQYGGGADIGSGCVLIVLPGIIVLIMFLAGGRRC